jgi:hypothetical protein
VPVSEFGAWAVSHMGLVKSGVVFNQDAPAQAYSDTTIHTKARDYVEAVRSLHGPDYNVSTEPLDTETIARLGMAGSTGGCGLLTAPTPRALHPLSPM